MDDTATTYFVSRSYRERKQQDRNAAVVTAVHVARDIYIEMLGNRHSTPRSVLDYMLRWCERNGADIQRPYAGFIMTIHDLVQAVWALAELPDQDPLTLVEDTFNGTSEEARTMLTAQYERDLTHALSRITWKE